MSLSSTPEIGSAPGGRHPLINPCYITRSSHYADTPPLDSLINQWHTTHLSYRITGGLDGKSVRFAPFLVSVYFAPTIIALVRQLPHTARQLWSTCSWLDAHRLGRRTRDGLAVAP